MIMKFSLCIASVIVASNLLFDIFLSIYLSIISDGEVSVLTNRTSTEQCDSFKSCWIKFAHYRYDFFTSQFDVTLFCFLRFTILLACFVGLTKNRRDGAQRILSFSQLAFCLFLLSLIFSPLKLLALRERLDDLGRLSKFWLNFTSNILFSISGYSILRFVLCNVSPSIRVVIEDDHVINDNDNARLIVGNSSVITTNGPTTSNQNEEKSKNDELTLKATGSILWRLCKYCNKEWILYSIGFIFLIVYSAARMFIPYYTGRVVDSVSHDSYDGLVAAIIDLIIFCCTSAIFSGLRGGTFMLAISRINMRIRSDLFRSLVKQEIGFFDTTKTGELTSRLTADCQTLADTFALNLNVFLRNAIMMIGSIIIMFSLCWQITLLLLMAVPMSLVITKIFGGIVEKLSKMMQDNLAKVNEVADEVLGSMRTVRSFANEDNESKRYDTKLADVLRVCMKKVFAYTAYNSLSELSNGFILVSTIFYGGHLVLAKQITPAVLVSFLLYEMLLAETIYAMGLVYTGLMEAAGAASKVFELIDRKPTIKNDGALEPSSVQGRVEFKDVTFSYPSRPETTVLTGVSFSLDPGEVVALVGPSGGGKSSCISLLEHFYEPSSGQILLDGTPISKFSHKYFHKMVSLVGQEPVLYARSISENIAYGLEENEYDIDEIFNSARLANAHDFISGLNSGYKTDVGEKGAQLSGGQKQRVAIARAIIRRPRVLLLDEATSALDAESEHLVQQALYENLAGYSVLLIAHRLSTVKRADRIIVINNGQVAQQGNHEELLKESGLYRNLVEKQLLDMLPLEHDWLQYRNFPENQSVEEVFETVSYEHLQTELAEKLTSIEKYVQIALSKLCHFCRANFSGPSESTRSCPPTIRLHEKMAPATDFLTIDGESPNRAFLCLDELLLAKWVLVDFHAKIQPVFRSIDIWSTRCLFLLQKCLDEKSNTLKIEIYKFLNAAKIWIENEASLDGSTKACLAAEWSYIHMFYFDHKESQKCVEMAENYAGVSVYLTGVLGKKTRFQIKDVAQLVAETRSNKKISGTPSDDNFKSRDLPVNCALEHETLLETTSFKEPLSSSTLSPEQQAVLLSIFHLESKKTAKDELSVEKSVAYLDSLLKVPQNWCVQRAALIARCRLEVHCTKRLERCLRQLEQLVTEFQIASNADRRNLFFACDMTSIRSVEKLLAEFLRKTGAISAALDIYQRLEMWHEIVDCYRMLKMLDRAESLIRNRLEDQETPILWSALGDVTGQEEMYIKSWEVSGCRYAPAQYNLGAILCQRKNFVQAAESLEKAVAIQPLMINAWFRLGHCCAQIGNYKRAAAAYHRCVNIDGDNFEAWNNLADAYVNLNQKDRAYAIMNEALRCDFDNWRLWDNVALMSVELGHFDDTIKALHRLLDLKAEKAPLDLRTLAMLVSGVLTGDKDRTETKRNVTILFGRLTSMRQNDAELWCLYSSLVAPVNMSADGSTSCLEETALEPSAWEMSALYARKALNSARQKNSCWERSNTAEAKKILSYALLYTRTQRKYLESVENLTDSQKSTSKMTTRFAVQPILTTIKKAYLDTGIMENDILKNDYVSLENEVKYFE